jgi:hypothetical protein
MQARNGADDDLESPPLLRRERSQEPHPSRVPLTRVASVPQPLTSENSAASTDSTLAAAAKGLALLRLPSHDGSDAGLAPSPPKHKRGEREARHASVPVAAATATPPHAQQRLSLKSMARTSARQSESDCGGVVTPPPPVAPVLFTPG